MDYGERLKYIRTKDLNTQEQVARHLKINRSTYKEYELQYSIMPTKHLSEFANLFNTSIDYILGFTEEENYNVYNTNINKTISGARLKELRKELGLSQKELASILNTVDTTISAYETGKNIIATPFLYTICKKYGISADYLLGRIDNPKYINTSIPAYV